MPALREDVTDEGLLRFYGNMGPVPCPHCSKHVIELLEIRSCVSLLRILGIGTRWLFRCADCGFDTDIPGDQVLDAKIRAEIVREYSDGQGNEETFLRRLHEMSIPSLNDILDQSLKWTCPKCQDENPATFMACWQCDEPHPELAEAEEGEEENRSLSGHYDPIFGSQSVSIQSDSDQSEPKEASE